MGALFAGIKDMLKALPWKTWLGIFVVGWLFGWFVFGWGIAPVKWTDAAPQHLEPSWRADYLRMAIESYTYNRNAELARVRYQGLGEDAAAVLQQVEQDPGYLNPADIAAFRDAVAGAEGQPSPEAEQQGGGSRWGLFGLCLVLIVAGGALALLFLVRKRQSGASQAASAQPTGIVAPGGQAPISSYRTTYKLGDDYFDESFSIDTASGEFLGEAGLSISEADDAQPKHVRSFEVWLFDKADIRTETAILCTPEAFADEATRQRMEAKGPVFAAAEGQEVVLETEQLRLIARVVSCAFGNGPEGQFFEELTVEFGVFQRVAEASAASPTGSATPDLPA